jgi:hypothetical protein
MLCKAASSTPALRAASCAAVTAVCCCAVPQAAPHRGCQRTLHRPCIRSSMLALLLCKVSPLTVPTYHTPRSASCGWPHSTSCNTAPTQAAVAGCQQLFSCSPLLPAPTRCHASCALPAAYGFQATGNSWLTVQMCCAACCCCCVMLAGEMRLGTFFTTKDGRPSSTWRHW